MNGHSKRTDEESCDGLVSDRQLLGQFVDHDDENAFADLVSRYCGLVLNVCRRILRDEHDAEDAFQATFLVLARRASQIRKRSSLAGWLYSVAFRTAQRASTKRHRQREEKLEDDMIAADDILADVTDRHEQQLLDEELNRLPEKYREPLVLRYMIGKSNKQVARDLGLSLGVVEGRIKRGKDRLRLKLAKRGISLAVALTTAHVSSAAVDAATVDSLVTSTVQAAAVFRSGADPGVDYSEGATKLAEKELATMSTSTITTTAVTAMAVVAGLTLTLAGAAAQQPAQDQGAQITAIPITVPTTPPTPDGQIPVQVAMAKKKADSASSDKSSARKSDQQAAYEAELRAKYDVFDFKERSPAEMRIMAALDDDTALEFIETPLEDVISFLRDQHDIPIEIDTRALDDVGIGTDTPITRNIKGIRLRSALWLLLRDLDLNYIIQNDVMLITTPEVAGSLVETHVYGLQRLPDFDSEMLAEVIKNTIRPDTWRTDASSDKSPSPSDAKTPKTPRRAAIECLPGCLVITQGQHAHEEIVELLGQLKLYKTSVDVSQKSVGD